MFFCECIKYELSCISCPGIWPGGVDFVSCIDKEDNQGLFLQWNMSEDLKKRTKLVEQIRDLEIREE